MLYRVIDTGSKGNAVIYDNEIMVDCGVSFSKLKNVYKDLKIVLLTHIHKDHFMTSTIKTLAKERPTLRFACCEWLVNDLKLLGVKNIDVLEIGKLYDYKLFKVSPILLYHDVDNCGYRIFINNEKILHCTDTNTLEGISAKGYNLYAIEHNYDEIEIMEVIEQKNKEGLFAYEIGAMNSHLSFQQANEFINENSIGKYEVLKLHMSSRYGKK